MSVLQDPLSLFENLSRRELRELLEDICRCAQLDMPRRSFWGALRALCEHHVAELENSGGHGSEAGFASALHSAVSTDVAQMLASKSAAELDELREQISAQLQVGSMHRDARPPAPPPLCRLDCFAMIASHVLPSHSSGR